VTIFVYGTLQLDEVMEAVTGRRFEGRPAALHGYLRRRVRERSYPAVVPRDGERTEGIVFRGVDRESLARLDVFEGDLYERLEVQVEVQGEGGVGAWAYVLAPEHADRLSPDAWYLEEFLRDHGRAFIEGCRRFREEGVA